MSEPHWIHLAPSNINQDDESRKAVAITANECIIVTSKGIHKYDKILDAWELFVQFADDNTKLKYFCSAVDTKLNIAYIYNKKVLLEIDLKTKSITRHKSNDQYDGDFARLTVTNSTLHIVGGFQHNQHLIWNRNDKKYQILYQIESESSYLGVDIINIKSRQILMRTTAFSGTMVYDYSKLRYKSHWIDKAINMETNVSPWSYDMIDETSYMILMNRDIFIVDVDSWKVYKTKISAPFSDINSICSALGLGLNKNIKKKIVQGYVLRYFGVQFPMDLVGLLVMFYGKMDIHFFADGGNAHCKIALDILIDGMQYLGPVWEE